MYHFSFCFQRDQIDRLLKLKDQQLDIFEKMSKLEIRESMQVLPKPYDQLEYFIAPDLYSPLIKNSLATEFKQRRYKIIQEAKRTWLNMDLHMYEKQYQTYHMEYQHELKQLELQSSTQLYENGTNMLYRSFLAYIEHHMDRLRQEWYSDKIQIYRRKLLRLAHRRSKAEKKLVSVTPLVMIDVFRHLFTTKEIAYLSRGKQFFMFEI